MKAVNSRMVARKAGVSQTTVSRVINRDPRVLDGTRLRVLEAARALGYDMRQQDGAWSIGVLVEYINSGYNAELLMAVCDRIAARTLRLELIPVRNLEAAAGLVIRGGIDLTTRADIADRWCAAIPLPLVRINAPSRPLDGIGAVIADSAAASRLVVETLRAAGHREIYFVSFEGFEAECGKVTNRWPGFVEAMRGFDRKHPEQYGVFFDWGVTEEEILRALKRAVDAGGTAFFCPNINASIRLDPLLRTLGLRVPEEVSIVSWEFSGISAFLEPPRTTIAADYHEFAEAAVDMLTAMVEKGDVPMDRLMPLRLVNRRSVGPAPRFPGA